jgi:hypothetical protein
LGFGLSISLGFIRTLADGRPRLETRLVAKKRRELYYSLNFADRSVASA